MRRKMLWIFFIILLIFSIPPVNMIGVTVAQETHDIAVTSISSARVTTGELVNVTVVVKNDGTVNETFNVTLYYDSTPIKTQNITDLASGATTTLLFVWNTTDVLAGTYTIKAVASQVEDETNTANNMVTSPIEVEIKSTYIAVVPESTVDTTLTLGKNYTVSIYTDYNGSDVWGWEFSLTYNPSVLEGIEVTNGDLITTAKDPSALFLPGTFDNVAGKLTKTANAFFLAEPGDLPVTSGPGTLANVTFEVVGTGDSYITLGTETIAPTRLVGINATTEDEYNIIDDITPEWYHILHGYFRNTAEAVTHDIAVISVAPNTTSVVAGEPVDITVVVENQGNVEEKFDVDVYYDYHPDFPAHHHHIGNETVSDLAAGANKSLTFTWDTTGLKEKNRTITGVVSELADETDTEDNTLQSPQTVYITERQEQPLPLDLIIGVPVAVVIVIAVAYYALKRRKKPTPE